MTNVAQTILSQLGGNRFLAMTGAKNLVNGGETLSFSIPKTGAGINRVSITLDCNDTYRVEFLRYSKLRLTILTNFSNVYCDQLAALFTDQTGLATSL